MSSKLVGEPAGSIVDVRLLGGFELRRDDQTLPAIDSARAASLLAYLVLHRDTNHSRRQLAYLLWPDSTDTQARTNLRHLLHKIRRSPEINDLIQITPHTVGWRLNTRIDVTEFESVLDRAAELDGKARLITLGQAVEAYPGDLLPGCYDDWLLAERERLRTRFLDALHDLGVLHHRQGDQASAAGYLERLVREDPLRESAYHYLMLAYDARGDRSHAVRSYHVCVSTLERELGVGPSPLIHETYRELLPDLSDGQSRRPIRPGEPALVGRRTERDRLVAAWRAAEVGQAQLVLLTGEPGVGKTRLAEEFAAWCARHGAVTAKSSAHAADGTLSYAPVVGWLRSPTVRTDRIVLAGTGIAGWRGRLPGVEHRPYIIRFTEDRPNPLYRRVCYTLAWSEVIAFAVLNLAGLIGAIVTGEWRLRQMYEVAYFPIAGSIWLLGAMGRLPRVKRSTEGEGHERRYFYGSVWAVCLAQPVLWLLWGILPRAQSADVVKLVVFSGILVFVGHLARRGLLPRTRPIVPGELAISD